MTGGMAKYWIIPRVEDKELPRVDHQLAFCSLLNSYVPTHTHTHTHTHVEEQYRMEQESLPAHLFPATY